MTKVCPLLRQASCFVRAVCKQNPSGTGFWSGGFPFLKKTQTWLELSFCIPLAVKLQASRLANQACQILTMGWLEQVIPGLPWNGQHGRLLWWFKASLMKDLIQCKHLANEYTESPVGEEHRLKLPCYRQLSVCLAVTALLGESSNSNSSFCFWFGFWEVFLCSDAGLFSVVLFVVLFVVFFLICEIYGITFSRLNWD